MKKSAISFLFMLVFFCVFATASHSATVSVSIIDFAFSPLTVTINAGDTVKWTNNGSFLHTATSGTNCPISDGKWDSGDLSSGQSFTTPAMTFSSPGTYPYFCTPHCFTGTIVVNAATLPLPTDQQVFPAFSTASPVLSTIPSLAEPIAIGSVATGGKTFRIQVGLVQASGLMDVYFAVSGSALGPGIFVLTSANTLQPISAGLVPWMSGLTGPINMTLLPDTPTSILAPGTYTLYLAVTPHGSIGSFYVWITDFTI